MRRRDVLTVVAAGAAMTQATSASGGVQMTNHTDADVLYFGNWVKTTDQNGLDSHRSNMPYHNCELVFMGSTIRWLGARGPDHGFAEVFVDGVHEQTIDAYARTPLVSQVLFEKTGLGAGRIHTLRIVVRLPGRTSWETLCIDRRRVSNTSALRSLALTVLVTMAVVV